jgi:chromosome segregation ATPase
MSARPGNNQVKRELQELIGVLKASSAAPIRVEGSDILDTSADQASTIREKDEEINRLRHELGGEKQLTLDLTARIAILDERLSRARAQPLPAAQAPCTSPSPELLKAKATIDALRLELETVRQDNEKKKRELARQDKKIEGIQKQEQSSPDFQTARAEAILDKARRLKEEAEAITRQGLNQDSLTREIERQKNSFENLNNDFGKLVRELAEVRHERDRLNTENLALKQKQAELESELQRRNFPSEDFRALKQRGTLLEAQNRKLTAENEVLAEKCTTLERKCQNAGLSPLKSRCAQLEREYQMLRERANELKHQRDEFKAHNIELTQNYSRLENENRTLERKCERLEAQQNVGFADVQTNQFDLNYRDPRRIARHNDSDSGYSSFGSPAHHRFPHR